MITEILQTVGICIGSVALVVIAFSLFMLSSRIGSIFPPFGLMVDDDDYDDEDDYDEEDDEEIEIVVPPRKNRRPRRGEIKG